MNAVRTLHRALLVVLASGCASRLPIIEVRPLESPNPVAWEYPLGVEELHRHVKGVFLSTEIKRFREHAPYDEYVVQASGERVGLWGKVPVCTADRPVSTYERELFSKFESRHDILLNCAPMYLTPSDVYRGPDGPLLYAATYHLHLEELGDERSRITVRVIDPRVIVEIGGFDWHSTPVKYDPVDSTTIEEYRILRYVGATLGIEGMPELRRPRR